MEASSLSLQHQAPHELIHGELALIPTAYGQLVYLAGLLDPNTGRYNRFTASSFSQSTDLSAVCRQQHEAVFQAWLRMPLQMKMSDVQLYIASLSGVGREELIDAWLRLTPYKNLVPASIQGPERDRHISDFEAILGLLKNVYGVALPYLNA